ncbi:hypothetical protein [Niveibacterium terrae]|uniref:hypothetical protein n=1 Tax=Niveibacterium terrae TaxID=3373598 RepID=UPI003A8D6C3B
MLNREQVTAAIREWMERVQGADAQLNAAADLFGGLDYDGPLPGAVSALSGGYTKAVSKIVGDEGDWLEYFWIDCAFGATPMGVIPDDDAQEIKIDGPEAIAEVICWDREHGEAAR